MKTYPCLLFALIASLLSGCATRPLPVHHPDPKVGVPAEVGGVLGMVVALPVALVLSPVTSYLSKDLPGPSQGMAMAAPMYPFGWVAGNAVGAVPWLLFGWWGNEKYTEPPPTYGPRVEAEEESNGRS